MHTRLITGPMKAGKTRQLVLDLEQYVIAKKNVAWFEPNKDSRGGSHGNFLTTRIEELKNSPYVHSFKITKPQEIFDCLKERVIKDLEAIFIDEFFMIPFERSFFYEYSNSKLSEIPITFAGLISAWSSELFPSAINVIPFMDEIIKTNAICMECGEPANFSYFVKKDWDSKDGVTIDTGDNYECLCHKHYYLKTKGPQKIDPRL